MSQLNMKELYSTINEKTLKRMETYDEVLLKCHKRIKYNATLQRTYCFYQIPEFIIGVPLFDPQEMKTYVMNSLKTNGFRLMEPTLAPPMVSPCRFLAHKVATAPKLDTLTRAGRRGFTSEVLSGAFPPSQNFGYMPAIICQDSRRPMAYKFGIDRCLS